ncbi:MAG: hypothetical protein LBQ32_13355 [Burkholderiaceae bacterium]|jgi:hypothetical protein|nr:hypothetical protein [Burkholderiaceae bacterium]
MAHEDSFPPHKVPTLTEVVPPARAFEMQPQNTPKKADSGWAPLNAQPSAPTVAVRAEVTVESVTAAVIRQLTPELEPLIVEAVTSALYDQLAGFDARVRQAMTDVVSKAVARLAQETAPPQAGGRQ